MKKNTKRRNLTPCIPLKSPIALPLDFPDVVTGSISFEKYSADAEDYPIHVSNRYYSPRRTGFFKPTTKKVETQKVCQESPEVSSEVQKSNRKRHLSNILCQNYDCICEKQDTKRNHWKTRISNMIFLLNKLYAKRQIDPENKDLEIQIKKLERSLADSKKDFFNYRNSFFRLFPVQLVSSEPLYFPEKIEVDCNDTSKSKTEIKRYRKESDKAFTQNKRCARKSKRLNQEFFMGQLEDDYEDTEFPEGLFAEFNRLYDNLIKAEKALKSPWITKAAYVVYEDSYNEHPRTIDRAHKILATYVKAVNEYEAFINSVTEQCLEEI